MNLEAQLLQIIEQQQEQLKQQQQLLEQKCEQLNLVQDQLNKTLKEQDKLLNALENLDQYTSRHVDSLTTHFNQVEEKIKSLENRALPVNFLNSLQQNLEQQLQQHLQQLVISLNIENQSKSLIEKNLPKMLQTEIEVQITPLVQQFLKEKESVIKFQTEIAALIQNISLKL